jgi:hypothetical protein
VSVLMCGSFAVMDQGAAYTSLQLSNRRIKNC